MLGDDEHPISFLFEPFSLGGHVHVRVRAGIRGMRALAGTLTMRREEWIVFRDLLGNCGSDDELLGALKRAVPVDMVNQPSLDSFNRAVLSTNRLLYVDTTPFEIGAPE